jgi:uncharacterized membrane protein YhfC
MIFALRVVAALWGISFAVVMAGFFVDTVRTAVLDYRRSRRTSSAAETSRLAGQSALDQSEPKRSRV